MNNEFYRRIVLPNGIRILTSAMPAARSASISLYIGTGSRYERDEEAGLSHFLEHLLFKGSRKRPSAKEIAEAIDGVGGVMNGGTDRELTVYYVKVARPHLDLALDVLVDLVRNPLLDPNEFEKERRVVLAELAMVADSPQQLTDLLLDATLWPDQPLGRDVAGTPESVSALTAEMATEYLHRQYVANNVVIGLAGDIDHQQTVDAIWPAMSDWEAGTPSRWFPASDGDGPRCGLRYKKTEQAHIEIAVRGLPLSHPDRYPLSFLSVILGEGMSSRLFMELRERRGLVYDVHSYISHFRDTGAFTVYAGVDPQKAVETVQIILEEMARLRDQGPASEELTKARELSKGRLLLRMEDTRAVSGWLGGQELLLGKVNSIDDAIAEMEAVTLEDLQRVARELLMGDRLHLAVVGPYRSDKRFAPLLRL
ncbi:MAG: insulinase family protein [Dehalococcoidia bacterium]|nr:MAG: insulinase family protein [Dehalococcoidia bacterium]